MESGRVDLGKVIENLKKAQAGLESSGLEVDVKELLKGLEENLEVFVKFLMRCCAGDVIEAKEYRYDIDESGKGLSKSQLVPPNRNLGRCSIKELLDDESELAIILFPLIEAAKTKLSAVIIFAEAFHQEKRG
jgi:hypothetical protein